MQTYLRPTCSKQSGWPTSTTGCDVTTTTSTVEVNATGTSLRTVTRVGKFCNLPELLVLSSIYTDVVTRDEVPIALPQLADGQRRIMSIAPHQTARRCCRARCSGGAPACTGRMSSVNLVAAQR